MRWLERRRNPLMIVSRSKFKSEYYDPCQEAAQRSYRCLYRNGGDKSMCGDFFQYAHAATTTRRGRTQADDVEQGLSRLQAGMGA